MPHIQHSFTSGGGPFLQPEKSRLLRLLTLTGRIPIVPAIRGAGCENPAFCGYFNTGITPAKRFSGRDSLPELTLHDRDYAPADGLAPFLRGSLDHHTHERLGARG